METPTSRSSRSTDDHTLSAGSHCLTSINNIICHMFVCLPGQSLYGCIQSGSGLSGVCVCLCVCFLCLLLLMKQWKALLNEGVGMTLRPVTLVGKDNVLNGCEITRLCLMTHEHVALIKRSGSLGLCKPNESAGFDSSQSLMGVFVSLWKSLNLFLRDFVNQFVYCIVVEMAHSLVYIFIFLVFLSCIFHIFLAINPHLSLYRVLQTSWLVAFLLFPDRFKLRIPAQGTHRKWCRHELGVLQRTKVSASVIWL